MKTTRIQRVLSALLAVSISAGPAVAGPLVYQVPMNGVDMSQATAGRLSLTPASRDFGTVILGGSAGVSVVVKNEGQDSINVTGIEASSPYSQSNNCPGTLVGGASCSMSVAFVPDEAGDFNGTVALATSAGPTTMSLSGRAVVPTTNLGLSLANLDMNAATVGVSAPMKQLTVTNNGNSPATVTGIGVSEGGSDFSQANGCGSVLAPGASCTVNVSFTPSVFGSRTGTLNVYEEVSGTLYTVALQGFGNAAVLALSSSGVNFPATVVGYPSTQTVTTTNTGNLPAADLLRSVSGSPEFSITDTTCQSTLAANASCETTLSFSPASAGSKSANFNVTSSNTAGRTATLAGQGAAQAPAVSPSSASVAFDPQLVGTAPTVHNLTLTNSGNVPVTVSGLSVVSGAADFAQTNNCASLPVGTSCSVAVRFAPAARGTRLGALHLLYDANSLTVNLSGQGLQGIANLSQASVDFGNIKVAQVAGVRNVTVTNTGDAPLQISSVGLPTGTDFTANSACGTVAVGGTCTVTTNFTPSSLGAKSATVSITSDAGTTSLPLNGTGVKGQAATSASTLTFGPQQASTTSTSQSVTVTNTGTTVLAFTGVSVVSGSADFSQSNNCASVPVNGTCTVNVNFTPSTSGARTGTLALVHDGDGVATVALTGDGRAPAGTLAAPTFSPQQVATSATATATLTNDGVGALSVTAPTAASVTGSDFSFVSTTCASSVAVGGNCTVTVRFTPSATGARTGSLVLNTAAGSKTVTLNGAGIQGTASVSAQSLTYAAQQVASTSATQTVTVTNTGSNTLNFTGVGIAVGAADFAQSNNCASVAVNGTCTVSVTFTPSSTGARTGTLALTHDGNGITTVNLSGTGQAQSATLSTPSFANTPVGSSNTATATLTNTGIGALAVTVPGAGSVTGPDFSFASTTCSSAVAVGGNCTVTVRFSPSNTTARSGTLSVGTGAGTFNVSLGSTGIQGYASVSPSSLTFATRQNGTSSAAQVVTVSNTGTNTLSFTGVGIATGTSDFAQTNNCGSVAVNGSCTINVSFTPAAAGARTGTLALTHNGGGIATVNLSGAGQAATATITSNSLGTSQVGTAKAGYQTITNTGIGPVSLTGTPSVIAPFTYVSNDCPAEIAAGASCTVNLTFTPTSAQAYTRTVSVPTSAGTLISTTTGTGVAASLVVTTSGNLGTNLTPRTISGWHQTFQNNGVGNVTITGAPTVSGGTITPYVGAVNPYCYNGLVLAPNATCVVWTQINQPAGTYSGTLSLPSSAGTTSIAVSGTVVGNLSVSAAAFGDVAAGSTKDMTVTVSNTAAWPARNMTYGDQSPFSIVANNCGSTIAANGSCTMTVRFTATGSTNVSANYVTVNGAYARIRDPGVEETQHIGSTITAYGSMSGRSVYAALSYSPTSLAFGNVQVGQSSARAFTITNTGNITATGLAGVAVTGYSMAPSGATPCGGTLAAGASCTATATFTPAAAQAYNGNYGSSGSNITTAYMPVSGTGTNPSVALSSVSGGNALGVVGVLSDSGRWPVFVNNGVANVTITGHSVDNGNFWAWQGDSSNQGTCYIGKVLTPGATCTTFVGANSSNIADHGTTETLSYRGAGASSDRTVTQAYSASVRTTTADRSSIAFSTVPQNQWNGPVYVRITNNATNNVLRNLTVGLSGSNAGNFMVGSYTCSGGGLSGGQTCDIPVYFNPTWSANGFSATLNIRGGYPRMDPGETSYIPATGVAINVALSGNGAFSQATALDAAAKDFGGGWYGQTVAHLNWVYRNDGNVAMTLNSPAVSAPLSVASNSCSNVAPGAQCNILIANSWNNDSAPTSQAWTPSGATVAPAAVTAYYVVYSAVPVWGNTNIAFGNVTVGSSSTQAVTLYNYGSHTPYNWAANSGVTNLPADFSVNLNGCSSVAAGSGSAQQGGSCTAYVTFSPSVAGARGGGSVHVSAASYGISGTWATFSGTGVNPAPVFSSTAAPTSTSANNQTGTNRTHTITWTFTNPAGYAQTPSAVTAIQDSGSHTSVYVDTAASSCKVGTAVGAGGSCTVVVKASGSLCAGGVIRASVTTPGGTGYTAVPRSIGSACG